MLLLYLVLPTMGMKGYILVIYLTEILNASLSITRLFQVTAVRPRLLKVLFIPLFSVIGSTAIVRMLAYVLDRTAIPFPSGMGGLVFHISLAVLLYLVLLFRFGAIKRSEIRTLRRRLRKGKS